MIKRAWYLPAGLWAALLLSIALADASSESWSFTFFVVALGPLLLRLVAGWARFSTARHVAEAYAFCSAAGVAAGALLLGKPAGWFVRTL